MLGLNVPGRHAPLASTAVPAPESREGAGAPGVIVCRNCRRHITDPSQAVSINGVHAHTFANPHGYVYDIGCFQSAVGCAIVPPSSTEFTWFSGYDWRLALCGGCDAHLGWFFSGPGSSFFGLILERLAGD